MSFNERSEPVGAVAGARCTRSGRIKIRTLDRSNAMLYLTLAALVSVSVFTFAIMDYGEVSLLQAAFDA